MVDGPATLMLYSRWSCSTSPLFTTSAYSPQRAGTGCRNWWYTAAEHICPDILSAAAHHAQQFLPCRLHLCRVTLFPCVLECGVSVPRKLGVNGQPHRLFAVRRHPHRKFHVVPAVGQGRNLRGVLLRRKDLLQNRAQLDHHHEHLAEALADVEVYDLIHQYHVAGAADGQPFGDALDDAQDNILAALDAGMNAILVDDPHAAIMKARKLLC